MVTTSRLRRAAAFVSVTAALVATTGCGLFGGGDEPTLTGTTLAPPVTIPRSTTELLDAGEEPRQVLRFAFGPGSTTVDVVVDLDVTQDGGEPVVLDLPPIRQRLRLTTAAPEADGNVPIDLEVEAAAVDGASTLSEQERASVDEELSGIVGLRGAGSIDQRGRVVDFAYDAPDDLDPALSSVIDGLSDQVASLVAPVPDEPVGVGARWRATTNASVGGASVPITTVFEITAIDGDDITYSSTSEGSAADRPLSPPGLAAGTTMHLVDLRSTGRGTGRFSLVSLAATADVRSETVQSMTLDGPDGSTPVSQRTTSHLVVAPVG